MEAEKRRERRRIKKAAESMFNESDEQTSAPNELNEPMSPDEMNEFMSLDSSTDGEEAFDFDSIDIDLNERPISSDENEEDSYREEKNLVFDLATWANKHNLSREAVNDLLGVLLNHGLDLPKDSRTLLRTPRHVDVTTICGGSYHYIGIEKSVLKTLRHLNMENFTAIELSVNIDGLPLTRSNNSQLWPILASINKSSFVFPVAIFHSFSKPKSVAEYLKDFILEAKRLVLNGIIVDGAKFDFKIKCFISDAPARSFLKCIIGHTGYNACERCKVVGSRVQNRITFDNEISLEDKRSSEEFSSGKYLGNHQKELSPLIDIGINCIEQFPLDYMHLVLLGVLKRILVFLIKGPKICKLSYQLVSQISEKLQSHRGKIPSEFNRQPRLGNLQNSDNFSYIMDQSCLKVLSKMMYISIFLLFIHQ